MLRKYATAEVLDVRFSSNKLSSEQLGNGFSKLAKPSEITDDGYLYVTVRAISSRVNKNNDGWPSLELARTDPGYGYKTFENRPIFIDHNNDDPDRTRGVVVSSTLHVEDEKKSAELDPYYSSAPKEHLPPTWIELMLEVDAKEYPKLAKEIISGNIDSVSMGANIDLSKCSVCDHEAENPTEYCSHVQMKGATFEVTSDTGEKSHKKAYEDCYGVNFFEISFVFDPADETALVSDMSPEREAAIQAMKTLASAGLPIPPDLEKQAAGPGYIPHSDDPKPYDQEAEGDDFGDDNIIPHGPSDEAMTNAWVKEQFMALGLSGLEADQAIMAGVDYHDLGNFLQQHPGATPDQALRIISKTADNAQAAAALYHRLRQQGIATTEAMQQVASQFFRGDVAAAQMAVGQRAPLVGAGPDGHEHHNLDMHRQDVQRERNLNHEPQADKMTAPQDVDTLRPEIICKNCGSSVEPDNAGQLICQECGFEVEPEGLDNPDLDLAKDIDLRQDKTEEVSPEGEMETELEHDKGETDMPAKNPIRPVAPISSTQSDIVSDEMKFSDVAQSDLHTSKINPALVEAVVSFMEKNSVEVQDEVELARILTESKEFDGEPTIYDVAAGIEYVAAVTDNADSKSTTKVVTDKKKPAGSPASQAAGERIISDQLEPVESNKFEELASNEDTTMENEKTADRETIKREETDGTGVTRTEEITKEYGPMAEAGEPVEGEEAAPEESEEESAPEEGEESPAELDSAAEGDAEEVKAEGDEPAEEFSPHNIEEEEKVPAMASTEGKLMAALKLAKLAASIGVISTDDELEYAGTLEASESMEEINARQKMLESVKEAGLSKKRRPVVAGRLPSFVSKNASLSEVDDADDSALFL